MAAICLLLTALAPAETNRKSSRSNNRPTATKQRAAKSGKVVRSRSKKKSRRSRGQQNIDVQRAREIQAALIRARYLEGEANGLWDQRTKSAMLRFQQDNGWQTKVLPDSRALIKLGLGPTHEGAINRERTSINQPAIGGDGDSGNILPQR